MLRKYSVRQKIAAISLNLAGSRQRPGRVAGRFRHAGTLVVVDGRTIVRLLRNALITRAQVPLAVAAGSRESIPPERSLGQDN